MLEAGKTNLRRVTYLVLDEADEMAQLDAWIEHAIEQIGQQVRHNHRDGEDQAGGDEDASRRQSPAAGLRCGLAGRVHAEAPPEAVARLEGRVEQPQGVERREALGEVRNVLRLLAQEDIKLPASCSGAAGRFPGEETVPSKNPVTLPAIDRKRAGVNAF